MDTEIRFVIELLLARYRDGVGCHWEYVDGGETYRYYLDSRVSFTVGIKKYGSVDVYQLIICDNNKKIVDKEWCATELNDRDLMLLTGLYEVARKDKAAIIKVITKLLEDPNN